MGVPLLLMLTETLTLFMYKITLVKITHTFNHRFLYKMTSILLFQNVKPLITVINILYPQLRKITSYHLSEPDKDQLIGITFQMHFHFTPSKFFIVGLCRSPQKELTAPFSFSICIFKHHPIPSHQTFPLNLTPQYACFIHLPAHRKPNQSKLQQKNQQNQ